jgi:hypothetical protein
MSSRRDASKSHTRAVESRLERVEEHQTQTQCSRRPEEVRNRANRTYRTLNRDAGNQKLAVAVVAALSPGDPTLGAAVTAFNNGYRPGADPRRMPSYTRSPIMLRRSRRAKKPPGPAKEVDSARARSEAAEYRALLLPTNVNTESSEAAADTLEQAKQAAEIGAPTTALEAATLIQQGYFRQGGLRFEYLPSRRRRHRGAWPAQPHQDSAPYTGR